MSRRSQGRDHPAARAGFRKSKRSSPVSSEHPFRSSARRDRRGPASPALAVS
jgi:hypothetical protein